MADVAGVIGCVSTLAMRRCGEASIVLIFTLIKVKKQTKRISKIEPRNRRIVVDNAAPMLYEPVFCRSQIRDVKFEHAAGFGPQLDIEDERTGFESDESL